MGKHPADVLPFRRGGRLFFWCTAFIGMSLLYLVACGGEVVATFPGCQDCPERCIKTSSGRGKCVQCLKDTQCQSNVSKTKRCVDNRCVCGTDADCPADSVCSPENGCVECVKDEHCGKDRPFCVEKACSDCKPGSVRSCAPEGQKACTKGQQTCRVTGRWDTCKDFVVCQEGQRCHKGKCQDPCPDPPPCKAGENACLTPPNVYPGRYKACVKDASGCDALASLDKFCGAQEVCSKGQCSPFSCGNPICKVGESRCIGDSEFQLCGRDTSGCIIWLPAKPCNPGEKCRPKVNKCTVCEPGDSEECYTGDPKLKGSGECKAGKKTCKADGSGYSGCVDEVLPKVEVCDGKDNDCDGAVDEEFSTVGDPCEAGVGACKAKGKFICKPNGLGVVCDAKGKGAKPEECNGLDDDCDGFVDNVPNTKDRITRTCYTGPANTKGVGPCKAGKEECKGAKWDGCVGEVKPTPEFCDKIDNDCDGKVDNGGTEVCNGKDDNCDGNIDEGLPTIKFYPDTDNDGFGDSGGLALDRCAQQKPQGYVNNNKDCDDKSRDNKPGAAEKCDGIDNDCDGQVDEGLTKQNWYEDSDGDKFGKKTVAFSGCSKDTATVCTGAGACRSNTGFVTTTGDCCDLDALAKPGQTQFFGSANQCGNFDYNCDGNSQPNVKTCSCSKSAEYLRRGTVYYYKNSTRYTWMNMSTSSRSTYTNSTSCSFSGTVRLAPSGTSRSVSNGPCCYECRTILNIKVSCGNITCINSKKKYCTASRTFYSSVASRSWNPRTSDGKQVVMWNKATYDSACIYHINGTKPKCGEEGFKTNSLADASRLRYSTSGNFYNTSTSSCSGTCGFSSRAWLSYSYSLDTTKYSYSKPSSTKVKVLCR